MAHLHFLCVFQLKPYPLGHFDLLETRTFSWLPQFPILLCYMFLFNFLILCTSLLSLPIPDPASFSLPLLSPLSLLAFLGMGVGGVKKLGDMLSINLRFGASQLTVGY